MDNTMHTFPHDAAYAIAYVRWQNLDEVYDPEKGFYCHGTIFPELNLPFYGRRARRG